MNLKNLERDGRRRAAGLVELIEIDVPRSFGLPVPRERARSPAARHFDQSVTLSDPFVYVARRS
jgi:hypothetical protein